jgi:tRNA(fMet)-specific endonuclease VapC
VDGLLREPKDLYGGLYGSWSKPATITEKTSGFLMKVMLDTNICIYIIKRQPLAVLEKFVSFVVGDIGVSAITLAELEYGAARSAQPRRNRDALEQFISALEVAPFDKPATEAYGKVRAALEKGGRPIGAMDLLIAAHALSLGVGLITNNEREFKRVPGLRVQNWV